MSRPARTTNAGQEEARELGLPEELVKLCTTSSAYHIALKEIIADHKYSKAELIESVTERFAKVTKDLHRITSFGSRTTAAVSLRSEGATAAASDATRGVTAAAAPTLRAIEGGGASLEVAALLGDVAHAVAAPLAEQSQHRR